MRFLYCKIGLLCSQHMLTLFWQAYDVNKHKRDLALLLSLELVPLPVRATTNTAITATSLLCGLYFYL